MLSMVHIDCLGAGIKIHCGLSLFLEGWLGWHHHMLFVSLTHHFLVRLRIRFQQLALALRLYQVRFLRASVLPTPVFDVSAALQA